jgi:hypothetical protein
MVNKKESIASHRFFKVKAEAKNDDHKRVVGLGHVCLVLKPSTKNSNNFKAALSFKSPGDVLNRKLGLEIAQGRLASTRPGRNFKVKADSLETAFEVAIDSIFAKNRKVFRKGKEVIRPFVPDWLHQAVVEQNRVLVKTK